LAEEKWRALLFSFLLWDGEKCDLVYGRSSGTTLLLLLTKSRPSLFRPPGKFWNNSMRDEITHNFLFLKKIILFFIFKFFIEE